MRIAFGADDDNECVQAVLAALAEGHEVTRIQTDTWPDFSRRVGLAVASGQADLGVLMCWTGTGTAIAANKVRGVRAATVADAWTATGARLWNDANVVALSLKRLAPDVAVECVRAFLAEPAPDPDEAANIAAIEPSS